MDCKPSWVFSLFTGLNNKPISRFSCYQFRRIIYDEKENSIQAHVYNAPVRCTIYMAVVKVSPCEQKMTLFYERTMARQLIKVVSVTCPCTHLVTLETKSHTFLIISDKNGLHSKASFQETLTKQTASAHPRQWQAACTVQRRWKNTLQSVHLIT